MQAGDIVTFIDKRAPMRVVSVTETHAVCSLGLDDDAPTDTFALERLEKCVNVARVELRTEDPDAFMARLKAAFPVDAMHDMAFRPEFAQTPTVKVTPVADPDDTMRSSNGGCDHCAVLAMARVSAAKSSP